MLGRLHGFAAGSIGDAAGPRGGTIAAAYRGLPVDLALQLFSAIEKPGPQSLVPAAGARSATLRVLWPRRPGGATFPPDTSGGGRRRRDARRGLHAQNVLPPRLGGLAGEIAWRRTRDRWGFGVSADFAGSAGTTDGAGLDAGDGVGGRLAGVSPWGTLAGRGALRRHRRLADRFDVFAIGGGPSTILPPGLDRNRVENPALPAELQSGERFTAYRAELGLAAVPLVLYGEWLRAGDLDFVRVAGGEVRLERLVPAEFGRSLTFRLGLARILSEKPRIRSTRAYARLVYRP